jgi:hypothetical protein
MVARLESQEEASVWAQKGRPRAFKTSSMMNLPIRWYLSLTQKPFFTRVQSQPNSTVEPTAKKEVRGKHQEVKIFSLTQCRMLK